MTKDRHSHLSSLIVFVTILELLTFRKFSTSYMLQTEMRSSNNLVPVDATSAEQTHLKYLQIL